MDHLPLPRNCSGHPSVPLLKFSGTPCRYEKSPFSQFPIQNGYDKLTLEYEGDYTANGAKSRDEAGAFVQEWLWFGLLSEFLERDIDVEKFICYDNPNGPVLTTICLPYVLTDWCRQTDAMTPEERNEAVCESREVARRSQHFCPHSLANFDSDRHRRSPVGPEVALSIQMMGFTLTKLWLLMQTWHRQPKDRVFAWGPSRWAVDRLLESGWCPSFIPLVTHRLPSGHYFAALLGPLKVQKDHKKCTDAECKTQQPDPSAYPMHARSRWMQLSITVNSSKRVSRSH